MSARKAEHALAQNVALNFVRPTVDGVGASEEKEFLFESEFVGKPFGNETGRSHDVNHQFTEIAVPGAPEKLGNTGLWTGDTFGRHTA